MSVPLWVLFCLVILLSIFVKREGFVDAMEDVSVPTRASGYTRRVNYGTKIYQDPDAKDEIMPPNYYYYNRTSEPIQWDSVFSPMLDFGIPFRSAPHYRRVNYSTRNFDTAPGVEKVALRVIPADYYQMDQMPTDLEGPYWPNTTRILNLPDYAWRYTPYNSSYASKN